MSGLQRPKSDVIDAVVEDCRSLSLQGKRYIEVRVTRQEHTNYDRRVPVSVSVRLLYETKRFDNGLDKHPIQRPETVANLCLDDELREELENPGYRAREEGIPAEINLQILARIIHLAALKKANMVGKVEYRHSQDRPFVEVDENLIRALSGGSAVPSEAYQIYDYFSA